MSSPNRIIQLAATIQTSTVELEQLLSSQGIPSPSFALDHLASDVPLIEASDSITNIRYVILEAMDEFRALLLGPLGFLHQEVIQTHNNLISLQAIARFQIAKKLPLHEEHTYEELAKSCGIPEKDLRRVLRFAMTSRIFREPRPSVVAHTSISRVIAEKPNMEAWISQACSNMWPAATRVVDAMEKWPGTEEPTHTGFNLANNTSDPFYVEIQKSPRRAREFADGMRFFHASPGLETSFVVEGYDWASLGTAKVVDVGGSHGLIAFAITKEFPGLSCVVQDLPDVMAGIDESDPRLQDGRVTFQVHDFFEEQPIHGADVYFFRMIFHNWSDKYCVKILRNLIPSLKKGARIVVNDVCLPAPGEISLYKERMLRSFDFAMKEVCNAQERDLMDWKDMFAKADPRFRFNGVRKVRDAKMDIIEAIWDGE
ncbi:hypothetical protein ACMFMG_010736 [Clarireedia jacksonii]